MDISSPATFWVAYITSNLLALLLLLACWKKPSAARFLFFLLFAWAGMLNIYTVTDAPEAYLSYADYAILPFYRSFILGWFSEHITPVITAIAVAQIMIALSMWAKGFIFKAGVVAAILFLIAAAPFGIASALPATLVMAIGLWLLLRQMPVPYLWGTLFKDMFKGKDRFSDEEDSMDY